MIALQRIPITILALLAVLGLTSVGLADDMPLADDMQPSTTGAVVTDPEQDSDAPASAQTADSDGDTADGKPAAKADGEGSQLDKLDEAEMAWYKRLRQQVFETMGDVPTVKYRQAESKLLEITDPKALQPMALVLYTRNMRWRSTFVQAARQYAQREEAQTAPLATAYLSDMAVRDPSVTLRGRARSALLDPATPKYPERARYLLVTSDETERDRAARLLADLGDKQMLRAMIELLVTEEWRIVAMDQNVPKVGMDIRANAALPPDMSTTATVTAAVPGTIATAQVTLPRVHITSVNTTVSVPAGGTITYSWEKKSIAHRPILDALRRLTGKDFGFDEEKWRAWLDSEQAEQKKEATGTTPTGSPYDIQW